jgi:hypothetical protein
MAAVGATSETYVAAKVSSPPYSSGRTVLGKVRKGASPAEHRTRRERLKGAVFGRSLWQRARSQIDPELPFLFLTR